MDEDVIAIAGASPGRRWVGILGLGALGALLIYLALVAPPAPGWQAFLIVMGAGSLWVAERMYRATERHIELTEDELRDSTGERIARLDDIKRIERGVFAFKPSNGFLVTLKTRRSRRWLPGLWWCTGRGVGIGGVMPGHQTKAMAQIIEMKIAERDQLSQTN